MRHPLRPGRLGLSYIFLGALGPAILTVIALRGLRTPAAAPPAPTLEHAAALHPQAPRIPPAAITFPGILLARESIDLAPRHPGRIRAIPVRIGDRVAPGDLVASLDARDTHLDRTMAEAALEAARAEQQKAQVELTDAAERFARRRELVTEGFISREERDAIEHQHRLAALRLGGTRAQIREKRTQVERLRQLAADQELRASFAGIVTARYLEPGSNVTPETPIVRLVGDGALFVRFGVPEERAATVAVGHRIHIRAGNQILRGRIVRVARELDAASRMLVLEADLEPERNDRAVLVGASARVQLAAEDTP
jgi:RND family efflux transporter MFP subunit